MFLYCDIFDVSTGVNVCVLACRRSRSFWMFWRVVLWRGWRTEARRGARVSRGQQRRSTTPSLCITPHHHLLPLPPPAWVQLLQKSGGQRLRVGEVEIARREVAVICCLLSFSSCWVKEEWEWWIRAEQWSAVAIIIITINTTRLIMSNLRLPQPARRNCPVSPILHPAPPQPLSRHLKIVPPPPHLSLLPLSTHPRAWENAREPPARGPTVPCPLSPPPHNEHPHPTRQPKRVAKKESRRTRGRYRSWRSRTSVWKQRLKGLERRYRGHVEPW